MTGQDSDCGFSVSGGHGSIFPILPPVLHTFPVTLPWQPFLLSQDGSWKPLDDVGFPSQASGDLQKLVDWHFLLHLQAFP